MCGGSSNMSLEEGFRMEIWFGWGDSSGTYLFEAIVCRGGMQIPV